MDDNQELEIVIRQELTINIQEPDKEAAQPTDVKERINSMKKIIKGRAYLEKYIKLKNLFEQCDPLELEDIELILKSDLDKYQRFESSKNMIPLFLSMATLLFALANPFLVALLSRSDTSSITAGFTSILMILFISCSFSLALYVGIECYCDRKIRPILYLLEAINKFNKQAS